ncbi:uncharacterized protein PHACADRAFT_259614 [Phanerochaete carnosa HHB-10118-sp]|uniref:Uncharacterized protein n=1 Tax=Phanerochaete carnosa (strain HHB-10118-sp) TaxID=650164 RepID=K5W353_PHACS|nr:uncharacterized protein PHACADRAFT_259614 [Phanerochaete carnosa HHB-10118-sp]EKM53329.1 hypothetical protein PHACADRAFT_259614 [Phanerochaete carnosa HHB-10118-sp]
MPLHSVRAAQSFSTNTARYPASASQVAGVDVPFAVATTCKSLSTTRPVAHNPAASRKSFRTVLDGRESLAVSTCGRLASLAKAARSRPILAVVVIIIVIITVRI